jgi:hypothetical protein
MTFYYICQASFLILSSSSWLFSIFHITRSTIDYVCVFDVSNKIIKEVYLSIVVTFLLTKPTYLPSPHRVHLPPPPPLVGSQSVPPSADVGIPTESFSANRHQRCVFLVAMGLYRLSLVLHHPCRHTTTL